MRKTFALAMLIAVVLAASSAWIRIPVPPGTTFIPLSCSVLHEC